MRFSFLLIGFSAVVAQILLVRELMGVFGGNELALGLMLASWLLWTAAGSGLAARFFPPAQRFDRLVAGLQVAVALVLPATLTAVRSSRILLNLLPGELAGPGAALLTCLASLSFFCLLSGGLFAAGSRLCAARTAASATPASGYVYWLEALGSAAGGVLASLLLVPRFEPMAIVLLLSFLNLAAAASLLLARGWARAVAGASLAAFFLLYAFPRLAPLLERTSQRWLWQGLRLVETRQSIYGQLALLETEGGFSLYQSGLALAHFPDPQAAEESVHFALAQTEAPRRILLIGGGIGGGVTEALKHPSVEAIDYLESDPELLELVRRRLPGVWASLSSDPRVRIRLDDGRLFLKRTLMPYDAIIVNLPDPQTAQLNRFYTQEFFHEARSKLAPRGVFSFRLGAAENYISPELAAFLQCINKTLRMVFPTVLVLPGGVVHFFGAGPAGALSDSPQELLARMRARGIKTAYAGTSLLIYRLSPDRLRELNQLIAPQPDTRINRDFTPVAYYFAMALWSGRFHWGYRQALGLLSGVPFAALLAAVAVLLLAFVGALRSMRASDQRLRVAVGSAVAAMGFLLIGLEVMLLLAFQAIYGFVYQQLAMLIAALMTGLAVGAWLGLRFADAPRAGSDWTAELRRLAQLQLAAALWPPMQCLVYLIAPALLGDTGRMFFSHGLFPAMAMLTGMLGGSQFLIASRIYFPPDAGTRHNPGTLYALDLAGSCAGALLLSIYLIPVYGFLPTALLIGMLNLAPAMVLIWPGHAH